MLSICKINKRDIKATSTPTYFQSHKLYEMIMPLWNYLDVTSSSKRCGKVWKISPYHEVSGSILLVPQCKFHVQFIGSQPMLA